MANNGYPDNDGSRDPSGQHDEGRQRVTCYDVFPLIRPANLVDAQSNADNANIASDSLGDRGPGRRLDPNYPIDGDAGQQGTPYVPAAYPSYVSAK